VSIDHDRETGRHREASGVAEDLSLLRGQLAAFRLRNRDAKPSQDHHEDECNARGHAVCVVCAEICASESFSR